MIPQRLKLINFQSYDVLDIGFDFASALIIAERDGNTCISNGAGKSSIFHGIAYTLFGKTKMKTIDDIVKRGTDVCESTLWFEHDSRNYKIVRKRNTKFSKSELSFVEICGDREIEIQGDTNKEIDAAIRDTLKTNYDVFLNSCYFEQSSISDFVEGTPALRQKIISSILNLDRWNKYMQEAKDRLSLLTQSISNIKYKLRDSDDIESDLYECKVSLSSKKEVDKELQEKIDHISEEVLRLELRRNDLKLQQEKQDEFSINEAKIKGLSITGKDLIQLKKKKERELASYNEISEQNRDLIDELKVKIGNSAGSLNELSTSNLSHLEENLIKGNSQNCSLIEQINEWDPKGICKCCSKTWDEHQDKLREISDKVKRQSQIAEKLMKLKAKIAFTKEEDDKIENKRIAISQSLSQIKEFESKIKIYAMKGEILRRDVLSISSSSSDISNRLSSLKERNELLAKAFINNLDLDLEKDLGTSKDSRSQLIRQREDVTKDIGALSQKIIDLKSKKAEKALLDDELIGLIEQASLFAILSKSYGRNGIQAVIIDNIIEELANVTNTWLNKISYEPVYVKFITQRKDAKGGWKETFDIDIVTSSGTCDFTSLSGGEAFRVAFAIRLGLSQIQARRMGGETQLLLLDEVSTSLDRHGISLFVSAIREIEQDMKVLVITHDDNLKEEFSHIIRVQKNGTDSSIMN